MKRILFLHTGADLYGAGYVFLSLLRSLDRTKYHPIAAVLPYPGPLEDELRKIGIPTVIHDMPVLRRKYFTPWGILTFSFGFLKSVLFLRRLIATERADLVYTNTAATWCSGVAAFSTGRKHVWQLMELVEKPWIVSFLMRKAVGLFSSKVFCISEAVRQHFLKGNRSREAKYATLYHGVDLNQYDIAKVSGAAVRKELGLDDDTVLVTYAGRISAWKGQDVFADAAAAFLKAGGQGLKIRFLILGSVFEGQERFLEELERRIEAIPDHALYISRFGFQQNLPEWFAASDIFVLPSKLPEPNATVIIGAMAMKLPVIGTDIGGTPETIVEGKTGFLIPPNDPGTLVEKIRILTADKRLRDAMGEAGHARAMGKFSLQNFCKTTMAEFDT